MDITPENFREKSTPHPRAIFRSKFWSGTKEQTFQHTGICVRQKLPGEIKGKLAIKAAKRARVRAMKANAT